MFLLCVCFLEGKKLMKTNKKSKTAGLLCCTTLEGTIHIEHNVDDTPWSEAKTAALVILYPQGLAPCLIHGKHSVTI
jgi:hypothetical protein